MKIECIIVGMKVDCAKFFFYPLHEDHSPSVKILSVIANIALTILSCGLYLIVFALVHCNEKSEASPLIQRSVMAMSPLAVAIPLVPMPPVASPLPAQTVPPKAQTPILLANPRLMAATNPIPPAAPKRGFVGVEALKKQQKDHLDKLTQFAQKGEWRHLQTHTEHRDSGFDWWMFPTDRASSLGDRYQVNRADIEELKKDRQFMENYRAGVLLVAHSWGWDLVNRQDLTSRALHWSHWNVRLGKMLDSLRLFGQEDLRQALSYFVNLKGLRPTLEPWIQQLLLP